jgi:glycosyltransferase involved in cell wall biosynthesis
MQIESRPKLVIFSAFYDPYMSGAEQMVKQIVENLGDKYEITLISGRYNRSNPVFEKRNTFDLVRIGIGHKQLDKLLYIFIAPFYARKIRPDIIHAVMESYAGAALVFAKYICSGSKRILTLQSGDLDSDLKQNEFHIRVFWKIIHNSPDFITAISSALARRAEKLGVTKEKIAITPNGLDFSEVPSSIRKEAQRVICVGRLSWEKAHELTLKAWVGVLGKFPSAKLMFVGEGPEREKIEKLISELGISGSVRLTGNLPHKQVLEEISKSEVFICPSLAEGLGNVFIEAQACGVPPIGTRVGGIPDVIQDGENGLLIEPKNSSAIADAIIRLLSDPVLRKRLSEKGLETSRKFEWSGITEKIDGIYDKIIQNSKCKNQNDHRPAGSR